MTKGYMENPFLTGSKKNGRVYGKRVRSDADDLGELSTLETIDEARKLKSEATAKWPHMLYWLVEIDFDLEEKGVEP